ncbi:MAG: T9SS type A sorting domain-containing protein [Winogradskyella sp.]|nr:MAG: T9SS type A sorting domain-containing protein [Winogradskyella sp.]
MKTKLLFTLALLISYVTQAQTEYTFTGPGNITDETKWSPEYFSTILSDASIDVNILGVCNVDQSEYTFINEIFADLNISGELNFPMPTPFPGATIRVYGNIHLDGGEIQIVFPLYFEPSFNATLSGTGAFNENTTSQGEITSAIIDIGDENPGIISFNKLLYVNGSEFIFDIYSETSFDVFNNAENLSGSSNRISVVLNNGASTVNSNSSLVLSPNIGITFFDSFNTVISPVDGFQPEITFNPTPSEFIGEMVMTFKDIEPPVINCLSDQNAIADCDLFYTIPDYTTSITATDNDSVTTITYTQSLAAGLGAVDGTPITITATDSAGNSSYCTFTLNVTEQTLGTDEIDDIVSRNISMFPNPSSGQFTLRNTSGLNLIKGELIDVKGALIQTIHLEGFTDIQTIDLSALNPAIYFFKIYTDDGVATKKIIIE